GWSGAAQDLGGHLLLLRRGKSIKPRQQFTSGFGHGWPPEESISHVTFTCHPPAIAHPRAALRTAPPAPCYNGPMPDIPIEQAIYGNHGGDGYRFLARSPGFLDDWLPLAQQVCAGFGERPAGVSCPGCVFARPFGKDQVAVVQAADQGTEAGRPGALGFRLL